MKDIKSNDRKNMSAEEFFKKWKKAIEIVDNRDKKINKKQSDNNREEQIPLF